MDTVYKFVDTNGSLAMFYSANGTFNTETLALNQNLAINAETDAVTLTTTYDDYVRVQTFQPTASTLDDPSNYTLTGESFTDLNGQVIVHDPTPAPVVAIGTSGDDTLRGGAGDDHLYGLAGNDRIDGNAGNDHLFGSSGNDNITGDAGYDVIFAGDGNDRVDGGNDADYLHGGAGNDLMFGGTGDDVVVGGLGNDNLNGGTGNDILVGGEGNDRLNGGLGIDRMDGGLGDDLYYVDSTRDRVGETLFAGGGRDTVIASASFDLALGSNIENLVLTGSGDLHASGNELNNVITGNAGANVIDGGAGDDVIRAGAGADVINGGAGRDVLFGGAGADHFVFDTLGLASTTLATADRIADFDASQGDRIDVSGIDANLSLDGHQSFAFIGDAGFSHTAGELRVVEGAHGSVVYGDQNGDGIADFAIRIDGAVALHQDAFVM